MEAPPRFHNSTPRHEKVVTYISQYTMVEDGDVYRIRLTDGDDHYDSTEYYDLEEALDRLEALKQGDGIHG